MRKIAIFSLFTILFVMNVKLFACWAGLDAKAYSGDCPVVVHAEITKIEQVTVKEVDPDTGEEIEVIYDLATLGVKEVLKNELKDVEAEKEVQALMNSNKDGIRKSTDLRYEKGVKGVWMLWLRDDKYFSICEHPVQLQPEENLKTLKDGIADKIVMVLAKDEKKVDKRKSTQEYIDERKKVREEGQRKATEEEIDKIEEEK